MGDLQVKSTIVIHTQDGERQIQLLFGDITKLPIEEKVDVIMVSAFPNDYIPTPNSVIGALKRQLGLIVRDLARNKEADHRRNFYCWWSHPLPPDLPYRRLMCFERPPREVSHPARLVGDLFRALVPAFDNQESTIITPILASGNQNFCPSVMLKAMVDAAAHWIQIGLPLVCLKIVIYSRDPSKVGKESKGILAEFEHMKKKWEKKPAIMKEPEVKFDVYLSYSLSDLHVAKEVESKLKEEKRDIKIFSDKQELDAESAWQEDIYQVMVSCTRVITFLSPSYLESKECVEQYNIALCCDRRLKRDILAPFYLQTIPAMPSYMQLMQYLDLRFVRVQPEEEEKYEVKLLIVCRKFVQEVLPGGTASLKEPTHAQNYDVFLSYCHKNSDKAHYLLGQLKKYNPDMKIFIDKDGLKTGGLWQKVLYQALDRSKCCVTLLSPDYLNSAICTEEYNLALVRHLTQRMTLIPVLIENVDDVIQPAFQTVSAVDARENFNDVMSYVARSLNTFVRFGKKNNIFQEVSASLDIFHIMEEWRRTYYRNNFKFDAESRQLQLIKPVINEEPNKKTETETNAENDLKTETETNAENELERKNETNAENNSRKETDDIVFSYHKSDSQVLSYISEHLKSLRPDLKLNKGLASEHEHLKSIDEAKLIVCLLSTQYILDRKCQDEFHIALSRHRAAKTRTILYGVFVERLLPEPTFAYMFPCHVDMKDQHWSLLSERGDLVVHFPIRNVGSLPSSYQVALQAASLEILDILDNDSSTGSNEIIQNIVKVKSIGSMKKIPVNGPFLKKINIPKTDEDEEPEPEVEETQQEPKEQPRKEARSSSASGLSLLQSKKENVKESKKKEDLEKKENGKVDDVSGARARNLGRRTSMACLVM